MKSTLLAFAKARSAVRERTEKVSSTKPPASQPSRSSVITEAMDDIGALPDVSGRAKSRKCSLRTEASIPDIGAAPADGRFQSVTSVPDIRG
jgi:hypothetical protein